MTRIELFPQKEPYHMYRESVSRLASRCPRDVETDLFCTHKSPMKYSSGRKKYTLYTYDETIFLEGVFQEDVKNPIICIKDVLPLDARRSPIIFIEGPP